MNKNDEIDKSINVLLNKPLWQMTGREYVDLHEYACSVVNDGSGSTATAKRDITRISGIHALAQYIGCSESMVHKLRREGVLEESVLYHIGKYIVFDGDKARLMADDYQRRQRKNKNK